MSRERGARVFVGRLCHRAGERDVERFFKGYGRIREINMKNGFAFIVRVKTCYDTFKVLFLVYLCLVVIKSSFYPPVFLCLRALKGIIFSLNYVGFVTSFVLKCKWTLISLTCSAIVMWFVFMSSFRNLMIIAMLTMLYMT